MKFLLPPVLFVIFLLGMPVVCWALGSLHTLPYPYNLSGAVLLLAGLGISAYHKQLFRREGANFMTFDEPTKFVTTGLFRYSRHPMYLGFVIALLGAALLYQAALSSLLLVTLFCFITDRWYIRFEESQMLNKYGDAYQAYCHQTPRWLGPHRGH